MALPIRDIEKFTNTYLACPRSTVMSGFFTPGESAGHGVDIDESLAKKYPYKRAMLPVNRLEDGTLWNW